MDAYDRRNSSIYPDDPGIELEPALDLLWEPQYHDTSNALSGPHHRLLAPAGGNPTVDYGVISVVVITLGMVLAIEVLRHRLDRAASGNPFFHTVLEMMYRELTTLGIVEFVIYLMHKYQPNFNYQMEVIFVDVHFMLFYTALFNAIQSCLVRLLTGHRTDRAWVQTEGIDTGHYVAIRKEFDRLESKLQRVDAVSTHSSSYSATGEDAPSNSCGESFREALRNLTFDIRHPHRSRRRKQLLVPLRFHELRAHFIESNNLPPGFTISHYLKRSLTSVLLDFVHVSPAAWILLMASANLLYFLSGMLLNVTKESAEVEEFLMYIFFATMIAFVLCGFALYAKMKSIYSKIMNMRLLIDDSTTESMGRKTWRGALNVETKTKIRDQRGLFPGSSPHLVIVATQFMQFGYALGLAMIFTYYKDFAEAYTYADPNYLLLALLLSYLIFLHLVSNILPWYTVCTSMGHMVNKQRLNETLAKAKLQEEIRKKESLEEERKAEEEIARRKREAEEKIVEAARARSASKTAQATMESQTEQRKGSTGGVLNTLRSISHDALDVVPGRISGAGQRKDTSGMSSVFRNQSSDALDGDPTRPLEPTRPEQQKAKSAGFRRVFQSPSGDSSEDRASSSRSWLRHARKKSLSDGVQFMPSIALSSSSSSPTGSARLSSAAAQQLDTADEDAPQLDETLIKSEVAGDLQRFRPRKSVSDNVALMRARHSPVPTTLDNATKNGASHFSGSDAVTRSIEGDVIHENQNGSSLVFEHLEMPRGRRERGQRRRRMKAQSEGVAVMRSSLSNNIRRSSLDSEGGIEEGKLATLSELTQMTAKDLPEIPGLSQSASPRRRHVRERSASDGVSFMSAGVAVEQAPKAVGEGGGIRPEPGMNQIAVNREHPQPSASRLGREERKQRRRLMKTQSEGVALMRTSLPGDSSRPHRAEGGGLGKLATLSELTQISAKDLPELPDASQRPRPRRRHVRERSASDGVSFMRAGMANADQAAGNPDLGPMRSIDEKGSVNGESVNAPSRLADLSLDRQERKQKRRLMKTQSEGVAFMRTSLPGDYSRPHRAEGGAPGKLATLSELTQTNAKELPESTITSKNVGPTRRRVRERSASTGVLFMRAGATTAAASNAVSTALSKGPAKAKVTFSLSKNHSKVPSSEPKLDIADSESFDSAVSDDGSDIDDVPDAVEVGDFALAHENKMRMIARKIGNVDLAGFYESSRYRIVSLLFGPMACFFFIARVEIFNIYAGVFVDQTNIWYKYLTPCFWVEVSLYCLMMVEMLSVIAVFSTKRDRSGLFKHCFAAVFGLLVNIMCLSLLLIAEAKRCCSEDDNVFTRLLGPASMESEYDDPALEEAECCPAFGTRRYGGLGKIEPFTSLIALSPLRFIVAGFAVRLCGHSSGKEEMHPGQETTGQHQHGPDPTTKVRDLWMAAIGVHSDIAKSFGLFSGELLQCMLGIYSHGMSRTQAEDSAREPESLHVDYQSSEQDSSRHPEVENSLELTSEGSSRGLTPVKAPAARRYKSDDFGVSFDDFAYPKSRLIRRMRRCERLLLPYLDEWMVVDVVLTNHELILFDVVDETDCPASSGDNAVSAHNNGGKGLYLCDVAKGRKKMHQFNLDDVDCVDIEHRAAIPNDAEALDVEANRNNLLEHWQGGGHVADDYDAGAMNRRWGRVEEDRLKIRCKNVTLYLRFVVDLKEMEHKSKTEMDGSDLMNRVGTQTKVWCRTIARLRGPTNLKQNLPHFGNDGTEEMEDFIEVCDRDHDDSHHNANKAKRHLHRQMSSFGAYLS